MEEKKRRRRGRPPEYSEKQIAELLKAFERYIEENDLPIIAEFAYMNNIDRTLLYDRQEFATLVKKAVAKKESRLERGLLTGEYNAPGAIFSLKQLGWRDRQEIEHSGGVKQTVTHDLRSLSPEELAQLEQLLSRAEKNEEKTS